MEHEDTEKSVLINVLAGIGIGVIVGAVAGLLFAPKAGVETRESVSHTLSDLGTKISDLSQQVSTKVKSAAETAKHAVSEKIEKTSTEEATEA